MHQADSAIPLWLDARLQVRGRRPSRKVHLDFHNTPAVGSVGHGFDAEEFVATLREGHVDSIVVFAKDMHGYFYYPAARGEAVHPGLDRDLLGEQVTACRTAGIKVYAYYCTTWDNLLAEAHPDWLVFKRDRTTYLPRFDETPQWTALCLSNPDFMQLMLDDTADLVTRYELDGVWFDMPFPIDGECFCSRCLSRLRSQGLDPLDVEVQRRDKQDLLTSWMRRSKELIESLRPGCQVDQNNQTRLGLSERAPYLSGVDIEALPTGGWGYHYFPINVRYARNFGVPACGLTGRFQRSWADFGGLKHPDQLRIEVAGIAAQGAQICIGDQPPPSGRLDPAVYQTIGRAYREIERVEQYLDGAAPVVEAAIIASGELLADPGGIPQHATDSSPLGRWARGIAGMSELLLDSRVQFDVAEAESDLSRYRLLVVPDGGVVTPGLVANLRSQLDRGGAVIASGDALRSSEGSQSWVDDVTYSGRSEFSTAYLIPDQTASPTVSTFPYALYGGTGQYLVEDEQATVLARVGEPLFERSSQHFTSHGYSPYDHPTKYAAAWHRGLFGGFGFDIGAAYSTTGYWVYRELFKLVLDQVLPIRAVESDLPAAVELSVTQQRTDDGLRWLVHIVPSFTIRRWGQRTDFFGVQPRMTDLSLSVLLGQPITNARTASGSAEVKIDRKGERTQLTIASISGPEIVILT